jgi:hypothetical protein
MGEFIWRSFRGVGGTNSNGIGTKIWGFETVGSSRVHVELNLEVEEDTWTPAVSIIRGEGEKKKGKELAPRTIGWPSQSG